MTINDRLHAAYNEAHRQWREAEIAAGAAGKQFEIAMIARKAAWEKLEAAAAALPDEVHRKVANEQFGLCEDEGCPHAGTPHVCIQSGNSS